MKTIRCKFRKRSGPEQKDGIGIASIVLTVILFLCGGCSGNGPGNDIERIRVDFIWELGHSHRSPEIHLHSVPSGTERLDIQFYDATNEWEHGGGSILYDGSETIPSGALKDFKGLSSVWGRPKIRLTVSAFNSKNGLIGKGTVTQKPP